MGLPSIVTDINGSNEIVIVDQNGLIVPPRQVEPLVQAMTVLADDGEMRQAMASRARKMVADRYDCNLVRQALYDFYASIGDWCRCRLSEWIKFVNFALWDDYYQ